MRDLMMALSSGVAARRWGSNQIGRGSLMTVASTCADRIARTLSPAYLHISYLAFPAAAIAASRFLIHNGFHPGNCDLCKPNRSRFRSRTA